MTIEFMTVAEVADELRVSKQSVYRMIERNELPHYKIGGSFRVARDDYESWRDGLRVTSDE